jgi:Rrf2 family protein
MFSQTAEYALRATVCMAQHSDQLLTTTQLAERTLVPQGYLSKVLQFLVRAEIIHAMRGLRGGYQLARSPKHISILDVVNAVDPLKRIQRCPLGLQAHGTHLCPLHGRLDRAIAEVESALGSTTLDEVINEPSASIPLCSVPGLLSGPQDGA